MRRARADRSRLRGWLSGAVALVVLFVVIPRAPARPDDDDDDDKEELKRPIGVRGGFQEAEFDRWIFQNVGDGLAGARKRLEQMLALRIDDIDRTCKLTEAQKKRVRLAGRGDIKQFYVLYDKVRRKFLEVRHDPQKVQNEIWAEIRPLQGMVQFELFDEDSLLFRSLHNSLTGEQLALFEAGAREQRASRHLARIEVVVELLDLNVPLTNLQRREVIAALKKLTKPPRKSGSPGYFGVMYQMSQLPDEKIKPLFDGVQWKAVRAQLDQCKGWKNWLRESGQLPEEDEEADPGEAKPAAGKG
jgi:hypothetical protein